jgi:bacillithiol biosynthesis cysteine-adding enzyme BshC
VTLRFQTTPLASSPGWDLDAVIASRRLSLDPALGAAFVAHGPAQANLELLRGGARCVTTGQQPGLFLGPMFTLYKALSAISLAQRLSQRLQEAVVPVFWVAGDDHDFAEANHVYVVNLANEVEEIRLRDREPSDPSTPLYRELLGADIEEAFRLLGKSTPETEFRPTIFEWARRHYRGDTDFASAFAGALAELLGAHGLVVLQPTHPAVKQAMAPYLLRAIEIATELDRALHQRALELEAQGHEVPVVVGDGATTVMIEGRLGRDRLMGGRDGFVSRRSGERWTVEELQHITATEPTRLSPNVLLRPAIEAALLPTLAYVAGPGELRYHPQCQPLYQYLDIVPQLFVPRWSARVLEARVTKVLEKYDVDPEDLVQEGRVEASLVHGDIPAEATAAMRSLRKALGSEYGRLQEAAVTIDPTLKKSVASHRNAALAGVNDIEKRIIAHLKKQHDILVQQIAKARHHLFPHSRPQERVFSVIPYLVRYGHAFVDTALEASAEWAASLESAPGPT